MSGSSFLTQVAALARRSTVRTMRQPAVIISALLFPMLFFSINASGLDAASQSPLPTDSTSTSLSPSPHSASLFGAITAGADLAATSRAFLRQALAHPMRPVALLGGMLTGVVALGPASGRRFPRGRAAHGRGLSSGVGGMLVIVLLTVLVALGWGDRGHTGDKDGFCGGGRERVPAVLLAIFLSSINLPRNLIEQDWFRVIATINPISYLVEGIRSLVKTGWDPQALILGFGFAAAIVVVAIAGPPLPCARGCLGMAGSSGSLRRGRAQIYKYFTNPRSSRRRSSRCSSSSPSRRPDAGRRRARLRLRGGLHRVPVRVGAAAGVSMAGPSQGSPSRATSRTVSPGGSCSPPRTGTDHPRLHDGLARQGHHDGGS